MEIGETVDKWFGDLQKRLDKTISSFVAFLFILISLGAMFGVFVATRYPNYSIWAILGPAIIALTAYYNRAFALAVFIILVVLFVFM